jgi:hypothetical protein
MPAETFASIYDLQTAVESASYEIFKDRGYTNVYTSRGEEVLLTPRIEAVYRQGSPTGRMSVLPDGLVALSAWDGQLTLTVVTDRVNTNTSHPTYMGAVISILRHQNIFNSGSILPYHTCQDLVLNSLSPTLNADDGTDMSAIVFNMKLAVKPDAWPTGST